MSTGVTLLALVSAAPASALDITFYGSLRLHLESVHPDNTFPMASYTGLRDAYSRIGVNFEHSFSETATGYAKLELPLDIANKAIQDPWNQMEDIRIAKFGLKGKYGNIAIGQQWMPYYNAIAYPVDMFSSYYSGFATFTSFRLDDTIAYYSPDFNGLSFAGAWSKQNGAPTLVGTNDDRFQGTISYKLDNLTLAGGVDVLGGVNNAKIWGVSAAWQATEALYFGAKVEMHDSNILAGYGADGETAANIYAGYTHGKHTFKAMLANVDNYGENILHLGYDYQHTDDLKFFVEFYKEEETAAITTKRGGAAATCWACSGGNVIAAGLRFDFSAP